jgi:hypothetical protein
MAEGHPESSTGTMTGIHIMIETRPSPLETTAAAGISVDSRPSPQPTTTGSEGQRTTTSHQSTTSSYNPNADLFETPYATTYIAPLSGGAILGIVFGSIAVVVIALCASRIYIQRRKREGDRKRAKIQLQTLRASHRNGREADQKQLPNLPNLPTRDWRD